MIEVAIAEMAAVRRTDDYVRWMAATITVMHESHDRGDVPRFVEADLQFHAILIEAADNAFLEALLQPLGSVIRKLREETSLVPETREHAIDYHGRILGRLDERDTVGPGMPCMTT